MNLTLLEAKVSKLENENNFLLKKVKKLAKALCNARAYPLMSVADDGPYLHVRHAPLSSARSDNADSHRLQELEAKLHKSDMEDLHNEQELTRMLKEQGEMDGSTDDRDNNRGIHADDEDEDDDYDFQDDDSSTTVTPAGADKAATEGKSMDQVRDENHVRLQKMMLAIHGPKAKRLTFAPSLGRGRDVDDDDEVFDPQWQRQERVLKEERQARKASLADDLRNRIDTNRQTRRPHSAAR